MLKLFNEDAFRRNERFLRALLYGIPTSILLGIAYGVFDSLIPYVSFSILYLAVGVVIGTVIKKYGRGIQVKFSILAAILALLSILLGDAISMYGLSFLVHPTIWIPTFISIFLNYFNLVLSSFSGIMMVLFRALGIYYAFINSRVI